MENALSHPCFCLSARGGTFKGVDCQKHAGGRAQQSGSVRTVRGTGSGARLGSGTRAVRGKAGHAARSCSTHTVRGKAALAARSRSMSAFGTQRRRSHRISPAALGQHRAVSRTQGLVSFRVVRVVRTPLAPKLGKKSLEHTCALVGKHPRSHLERMVEPSVGIQLVKRPKRACLGVGRAVNAAGHTRVHHKTRTHNAGLEGHIHRAAREPPASERAGRRDHRRELCMRRRVFVQLTTVVRPGDNFAFVDHNSPDGHLAFRRCRMRLDQRLAHEALVEPAQRHVDIPLVAHGRPSFSRRSVFDAIITYHGEMAERLNAAVLKTVGRVSVSRVRIPLSPPW